MKLLTYPTLIFFALVSCSQPNLEIENEKPKVKAAVVSTDENAPLVNVIIGDYLCTISENAGISSAHTESSGPPKAFSKSSTSWKFKMRVSYENEDDALYRMVEVPYSGSDRDPREWHTQNSVLHSPYIGNGVEFSALEGQAFVSFHKTIHNNKDGDMSFYHAGFAWAGGEDSFLLARWGRCKLTQ